MPYYKGLIQYDGSHYQGWQRLKNSENTLQGKIEKVLTRLLEEDILVHGSGRTDAGVHAKGQVFSFQTEKSLVKEAFFIKKVNQYLPQDMAVLEIAEMPSRFHARLEAVGKRYVYTLWRAEYAPVFKGNFVHRIHEELDLKEMKKASSMLLGEHDFRGFSHDKTKKSTVRCIKKIDWLETDEEIQIIFEGNGFLQHMIRIIVGTLLEIGLGKKETACIENILKSKDRTLAGETAPAKGLSLEKVYYDEK